MISTFLGSSLNEQPPSILIEVTGSAQDLQLDPAFEDMFNRGLVKASQAADAWIVTGGSHSGVMKLVGQARAASCDTF